MRLTFFVTLSSHVGLHGAEVLVKLKWCNESAGLYKKWPGLVLRVDATVNNMRNGRNRPIFKAILNKRTEYEMMKTQLQC